MCAWMATITTINALQISYQWTCIDPIKVIFYFKYILYTVLNREDSEMLKGGKYVHFVMLCRESSSSLKHILWRFRS